MQTSISKIATDQFKLLVKEYPEQEKYGGNLFLGKNYAKNRILFLGINPGLDEDCDFVTKLEKDNLLLNGNSSIRYWNNSAIALSTNSDLKVLLEDATYSFCCPFRTPTWNGLSAKKRIDLIKLSKPIMDTLLNDCKPQIVIVAGVSSTRILFGSYSHIFKNVVELEKVKYDKFHQWSLYNTEVNGSPVTVIQAPHFSYASNKEKLVKFNTWLHSKIYS